VVLITAILFVRVLTVQSAMVEWKLARFMASVCLGLTAVFGWAPSGWWPVLLLAVGCLYWLISLDFQPLSAGASGVFFGLAMHAGVYGCLYSTLIDYVGVASGSAFFYTGLVLLGLSLFTAAPCMLYRIIFNNVSGLFASPLLQAFVFSSLLTLGEYLRALVFARMSLQSIGYALIDTWWSGFAPVFGVYGLGWIGVMTATLLVAAVAMPTKKISKLIQIALIALLIALLGLALQQVRWTESGKESMSFRLIQSHGPQSNKLNSERIQQETLQVIEQLTDAPADIVITPETAFPMYWSEMPISLMHLIKNHADHSGSNLLMGVATMNAQFKGSNSMVLVKPGSEMIDQYNKIHLFPFGEYSPWGLGWLSKKFPSPRNDLDAGQFDQKPFNVVKGEILLKIGAVICNEILLSDASRKWAPDVDVLINPANTSWFSKDVVIPQVLQIARMRALEVGRAVLHVSNTGGTAVISSTGQVIQSLGFNQKGALMANIHSEIGLTPYVKLGDWPILLLCVVCVFFGGRLSSIRT
jgi:apolipoprotein N-acyltransferase